MIDNALNELVKMGVLGVLLVISLIVNYFLGKEYKNQTEGRLTDLKQYTNEDKLFIAQIKVTLANVLELNKATLKHVLKLLKGKK